MNDLRLSAFAPRRRFSYAVSFDGYFLAIGTGRNLRIFRRESAPISFLKHQKGNGRGRSKEKMFGANSASKMPLCESTGVFRMSSDTDAGGLLPGALYRLLG